MSQHVDVIGEHYPDLAPATRIALARISKALEPSTPDQTEAIRATREAARRDLEKFQRAACGIESVELNLEAAVGNERKAVSRAEIAVALRSGKTVLIEAEPGAGKSVALIQLAASILAEGDDDIAAVVLLPELADLGHGLFDDIAGRDAFYGIPATTLAAVARVGRLVLFCDGWNELSGGQRDRVHTVLSRFRRDYPGGGLLIATRALSPLPISYAMRAFLLPASRDQQLAILAATLGAGAEAVLNRARRTPGMRDLLRTPLYVAVLGDIATAGLLPATREEAIRRFIVRQEEHPEHSASLRETLQDCHRSYLSKIADYLTTSGTGTIGRSALRALAASVSAELKTAGQFDAPPEPQDIIDTLVAHHVLVERPGTAANRFYGFQHQQFREWFASFHVEGLLVGAGAAPSPETMQALSELLNQPDWTEPILFAIERLSRGLPESARAVGQAIRRAIAIDPMLGAVMIRNAAVETWPPIAEPVQRFANAWYQTEERDRAFRFMAGTGRPEFADKVWETIRSERGYDRAAIFDYGWFSPSVLGVNGRLEYAKLAQDRRRSLLWDLALYGGQEGIEFTLDACRGEPSAEVVASVIEVLDFEGAGPEFTALLEIASPEVWQLLARRRPLVDADGDFRARLLDEKRKLAADSPGGDKLHLLLELTEAGEYDDPAELIGLGMDLNASDFHTISPIFSRLAALDADLLSRSIVKRLLNGDSLPNTAVDFAGIADTSHQQELRDLALGLRPGAGLAKEIAARALNGGTAAALLQDLFTLLDDIAAAGQGASNDLRERYKAITNALYLVQPSVLISLLLTSDTQKPRHIAALAELLFRWRGTDRDNTALPIEDATLERLGQAVTRWADTAIADLAVLRRELCDIATAIRRLASPGLLPTIKRLLDADLEYWRQECAIAEEQRKHGRFATNVNVSYSPIYRQAIEAFQGVEARDLLLAYIGDPYFEVDAAFALRQYGTSSRIPSAAEGIGRPKYEQVVLARRRRVQEPGKTSEVATVLIGRIDQLLRTAQPEDFGRAIGLATAAAQMDYGSCVGSITAVLDVPGPMAPRLGLLNVLVFAGEPISARYVQQGFDEALDAYVAQKWHGQNEWWVIERWIELMAFTDEPQRIVDCTARLPQELKAPFHFDRIAYALGHIEPEQSLGPLIALAEHVPTFCEHHNYVGAFVSNGSVAAARHLMSLACNPKPKSLRFHDELALGESLSVLIGKHPALRLEFVQRAASEPTLAASPVIARVLPTIIDQHAFLTLYRAWDPRGGEPAARLLEHAMHKLAVKDRPIDGTNSFEREPFDLTSLRADLFRVYAEDPARAPFAAKLLLIVDRERDTYGRPPSEPRHPNLTSGVAWPKAAEAVILL
jgi:hypothetical protein